jgi:hypothetical protein
VLPRGAVRSPEQPVGSSFLQDDQEFGRFKPKQLPYVPSSLSLPSLDHGIISVFYYCSNPANTLASAQVRLSQILFAPFLDTVPESTFFAIYELLGDVDRLVSSTGLGLNEVGIEDRVHLVFVMLLITIGVGQQ